MEKLEIKRETKEKVKKQEGITLIAIVITIIVLLILAGVTIATLTGENGIITRASEAAVKTEEENSIEQVKLAVAGSIGTAGEIKPEELKENLNQVTGIEGVPDSITEESYPIKVTIGDQEIIINKDGVVDVSKKGNYYEEDTSINIGGKTVSIPGGATVSEIDGEYESVDNGFVIYITNGDAITDEDWNADEDGNGILDVQEDYDQFVWVPVEDAIAEDMNDDDTVDETDINLMIAEERYPMAISTGDGNYRGVLYEFSESGGVLTISDISYSESGYREPAYLTDSNLGDGSSYNNVGITETSLQEEFNAMITKVAEKGGFWVGRYETSNMVNDNAQDTTNEITVIKGTTKGINNVEWYRMYAQQKKLFKSSIK